MQVTSVAACSNFIANKNSDIQVLFQQQTFVLWQFLHGKKKMLKMNGEKIQLHRVMFYELRKMINNDVLLNLSENNPTSTEEIPEKPFYCTKKWCMVLENVLNILYDNFRCYTFLEFVEHDMTHGMTWRKRIFLSLIFKIFALRCRNYRNTKVCCWNNDRMSLFYSPWSSHIQ